MITQRIKQHSRMDKPATKELPSERLIQCKNKENRTGPEKMAVVSMKTSTKEMDEIN
jgi:hypothetical protein